MDLRELATIIVSGDVARFSSMLAATPTLASARFSVGATRQGPKGYYLEQIGRYIYADDTALHIAASAYRTEMVRGLIAAGADVQARNRLGSQPLHAASVGQPGSRAWNPSEQTDTIRCLIEAGADPNTKDKFGVCPLHQAARTRCAAAVETLLAGGADPTRKNKSGSTALFLAKRNTGRGGSGSLEAKLQQKEIVALLERHG